MTFKGLDIFQYHPKASGVKYSPELEWILAAVWGGYRFFPDFVNLDGWKQSVIVAAYRVYNQIEAVVAEDTAKKQKRVADSMRSKGK